MIFSYSLNNTILRKGIILLILSVLFAGCDRQRLSDAYHLYHEGKYEEAIRIYQKALAKSQDSAILNYNLGTAFYKKGDYLQAMECFSKALTAEATDLEAKTNYNIGNSKYRLGEQIQTSNPSRTIELYREAMDYYQRAIEWNDQDEDAIHNHHWVEKKLKDLLSQLEQRPEGERSPSSFEPSGKKEVEQKIPFQDHLAPEIKMEKLDQIKPSGEREWVEMPKEKAASLLEEYRLEEEIGMNLKESKRMEYVPEVQKDW